MIINSIKSQNILIKVIEKCLKIWIRSQCKSIKNLILEIDKENSSIIKGLISKVSLSASNINFQSLPIDKIKLTTGLIKINMRYLPRKLIFKEPFKIQGTLKISSASLEDALSSDHWNWLGDLLCKDLLGIDNFQSLKISNNILELNGIQNNSSEIKTGFFNLKSNSGKIIIIDKDKSISIELPIEESIIIKEAYLVDGFLNISGESKVTD